MTFIGTVKNGVIVLPPDVKLPEGLNVEVRLRSDANQTEEVTDALLAIATRVKNLPADFAQQHDHYLREQRQV